MIVHVRLPEGFKPFSGSLRHGLTCTHHFPNPKMPGRVDTHFLGHFRHMKTVGGSVEQSRSSQLHHLSNPSMCIKCASRNNFATEFFCRVMPGPESHVDVISKRNEDPVPLPKSHHVKHAGPRLDSPLPASVIIGYINGPTCCSRRLV
jgi:hypothetical protein